MKKRKSKQLNRYGSMALSLGGLGVGLGVSAAVAGKATAGTPAAAMMPSFGVIASGAGIATTAIVGKHVIGQISKLNKKKVRTWY